MVISLPVSILIDLRGGEHLTVKQGQLSAPDKLVHPE